MLLCFRIQIALNKQMNVTSLNIDLHNVVVCDYH